MGSTVINGYTYPEGTDQPVVHTDLRRALEEVARGGVMRFANATERTAAFATLGISPTEGMLSYRFDEHIYETYDGTTWSGAWPAYAVAWTSSGTQPAIGNGTLLGAFRKGRGELIDFRIRWVAGSTTTFGTLNYFFSLPFPAIALGGFDWPAGSGVLVDVSTQVRYVVTATIVTATTLWINVGNNNPGVMQATAPVTWANGDWLGISGSYEPA